MVSEIVDFYYKNEVEKEREKFFFSQTNSFSSYIDCIEKERLNLTIHSISIGNVLRVEHRSGCHM